MSPELIGLAYNPQTASIIVTLKDTCTATFADPKAAAWFVELALGRITPDAFMRLVDHWWPLGFYAFQHTMAVCGLWGPV